MTRDAEALEEIIADMKADAGTMRTRLAAALAGLEEANRTIAKLQAEVDRLHQAGATVTPTLEVMSRGGW